MPERDTEISYEIAESVGVVSTASSGWNLELNRVRWNKRPPKFDLRRWSPEHDRCSKGITLTDDEVVSLAEILDDELLESIKEDTA